MPKLTAAAIQKLKPAKTRREIRDDSAPGLRLVIQPSGAKSWAMRFRRPDGRSAKLTLGRVDLSDKEAVDEPLLGTPLTLRQARQLANKIDRDRARGLDVIEQHKADKSRRRAWDKSNAENTFGKAVVEFFRDYKTKWGARPRRWRGGAGLFGLRWPKDCNPAEEPTITKGSLADIWGDKPLANIDAHDIITIIDESRKSGIPGLARRNGGVSEARGRKMHSALSTFFRWALQRRKIASNPCVGLWHPGAPPARDRFLTDLEIDLFWRATDTVAEPFRGALRLLLLTGCRVNEVVGMRRDEVSDDGNWTIPGTRTKNHQRHILPLPSLALEVLESVPHIDGDFVFSTTGRSAISGWSKIKRAVDEAMGPKVAPWRLHDLRRTAASGMQRLGVRAEVIERALNHISGSFRGVAGTYQRDLLSEEVRAALLRWSRHVQGLITDKSGEVVVLRS
jgi:integrase